MHMTVSSHSDTERRSGSERRSSLERRSGSERRSGKEQRRALMRRTGLWLCLAVGAACGPGDQPPVVDHFTWINPITAAVVELPDGWRHCPDTARQGETTVGFFAPSYARMLGRYGHVTLHYEYIHHPSKPMTLERFVDNFSAYVRHRGRIESGPDFVDQNAVQTAHLTVAALHRQREILLEVRFWTADERDYWYAVIESEAGDQRFRDMAAPLVQQLIDSTLSH